MKLFRNSQLHITKYMRLRLINNFKNLFNKKHMKKIFFILCIVLVISGCNKKETVVQNKPLDSADKTDINQDLKDTPSNTSENIKNDWLINKLKKNFSTIGYNLTLSENNNPDSGFFTTSLLGLNKSDIILSVYDNNHEILGTENEFEGMMEKYSNSSYGKNLLVEKNVSSNILLKYNKESVMGGTGSMKNEYFFILDNGMIVKAKVTFPADPEITSKTEKKRIANEVEKIHQVLLKEIK
jgi:hypothetical protein